MLRHTADLLHYLVEALRHLVDILRLLADTLLHLADILRARKMSAKWSNGLTKLFNLFRVNSPPFTAKNIIFVHGTK